MPLARAIDDLVTRRRALSIKSETHCAGRPRHTTALVELVRASAESLVGADRDAARERLLAREIALTKTTLDIFVVGLGEHARCGNERGALLFDKLATGAARQRRTGGSA